ncbi:MAG TPA: hypothetical protein VGQ37_05150 [Vicinamibacterales bacterium]|jgi:hypothetical protein|nr:hypothetical protein [Vicinamibacterales bacterium]
MRAPFFVALAITASSIVTLAQAPAAVPRGADGKPDLTGVWQGSSVRPGKWEDANNGLGVGGTGKDPSAPPSLGSQQVITEPAPYQPWAAARVLESYNKRGIDDPAALCLPPGVPRLVMVSLFPIEIVQTPKRIVFMYEYMNVFRSIPIDAPHPPDIAPSYLGDSVARWEGNTLVVDVVGFNDKTWLTGTGTFHSEDLHLVERYTRVSKDRIDFEATIDDPKVLTKPWTIRTTMMLREGTRVQEYVCAENNQDPAHLERLLKEGVGFRR